MGKDKLKEKAEEIINLPANVRNGWLIKMVVKIDNMVHNLTDTSLKARVTKLEKRVSEIEKKLK